MTAPTLSIVKVALKKKFINHSAVGRNKICLIKDSATAEICDLVR